MAGESQLHATTITGDLTMSGDADIVGVDQIDATTLVVDNITSTSSSITISKDISMPAYDINCYDCEVEGSVFFGDSAYNLYESGGDLYWRGTKLN